MDDLADLRARYDANRKKAYWNYIEIGLHRRGTCRVRVRFSSVLVRRRRPLTGASETKEEQMNTKRFILAGCATIILSAGTAQAGPCDTAGRAASAKDAGSGPTVGNTGQTTGTSKDVSEHPPTSTMNRAAGDVATSSQDAQKQMQGQPTAAQQAEGVEPSARTADKGC
jgi:hypothetical protein